MSCVEMARTILDSHEIKYFERDAGQNPSWLIPFSGCAVLVVADISNQTVVVFAVLPSYKLLLSDPATRDRCMEALLRLNSVLRVGRLCIDKDGDALFSAIIAAGDDTELLARQVMPAISTAAQLGNGSLEQMAANVRKETGVELLPKGKGDSGLDAAGLFDKIIRRARPGSN